MPERFCQACNEPDARVMSVLAYRGTVFPWHCDHMGHMNVMWYVGKFDKATWHLLASIGVTRAYRRDSGSILGAVQ
jgi:acyl-CoA thioester hydrolase